MNLYFMVVGSGDNGGIPAMIDFPFQTQTSLTWKVMGAEPSERYGILEEYINEWDVDEEYKKSTLEVIRQRLADPNLEITYL
jgi:hypothetical protein